MKLPLLLREEGNDGVDALDNQSFAMIDSAYIRRRRGSFEFSFEASVLQVARSDEWNL